MKDFNSFTAEAVIVSFDCPKCGSRIESDEIVVPEADMTADTAGDSTRSETETLDCPNENCGASYDVSVYSSIAGGHIDVEHVEEFDIQEIDKEAEPLDPE